MRCKFRGDPQTPSKEVLPDKMSMGSCKKIVFLLVLQSLCMNLQNSNGKLLNLVFLKNCSILVLKLETLIQNRRALIAVSLFLFYPGARSCYSFINVQDWIHKQNFVEFRSKLSEHEQFEVCISKSLASSFPEIMLLFQIFLCFQFLNLHYLCFKMSCHWEKSTKT